MAFNSYKEDETQRNSYFSNRRDAAGHDTGCCIRHSTNYYTNCAYRRGILEKQYIPNSSGDLHGKCGQ